MSGPEGEKYKTTIESIDPKKRHKMLFIVNAVDKGWSVRKRNGSYIFSKKHEGRKEVFNDMYLDNFIDEML
jgi:hypothetical protein